MVNRQFLPLLLSPFSLLIRFHRLSRLHHGAALHTLRVPVSLGQLYHSLRTYLGRAGRKIHQKSRKSSRRNDAGIRHPITSYENHGTEKQSPRITVLIPGYLKQALRIDYPKNGHPMNSPTPPGGLLLSRETQRKEGACVSATNTTKRKTECYLCFRILSSCTSGRLERRRRSWKSPL